MFTLKIEVAIDADTLEEARERALEYMHSTTYVADEELEEV